MLGLFLKIYNGTVSCIGEFTSRLLSDRDTSSMGIGAGGMGITIGNGNKTIPVIENGNGNEPLGMGGNGIEKDIPAYLLRGTQADNVGSFVVGADYIGGQKTGLFSQFYLLFIA